ncbi:MAG: ribonuclease HIII [bacterium]
MNHVFKIDETQVAELLEYYQNSEVPSPNADIVKMFKSGDLTVSLYHTGKVLLQGNDALDEYLMWSEIFGFKPEIEAAKPIVSAADTTRSQIYFTSAIGSDEVGTGDFFGPVVVCAAYVSRTRIPQLEALKIRDSKKLTDDFIRSVADELGSLVPHVVLVTDPTKYNDLIAQGFNMNKIKAYLHNHAIKKCLGKADGIVEKVIVDEFCSADLYFDYLKEVDSYHQVTFLQRGESAHLSVAAASVLARHAFLKRMAELDETVKIRLPLGAGPAVDLIGKRIVLEHGFDYLNGIAKTHFKNTERIREMTKRTI